jgi:hypothetical protein
VRLPAERMKNSLGQPIVIENTGGGTICVDRVSRPTATRWCSATARAWCLRLELDHNLEEI